MSEPLLEPYRAWLASSLSPVVRGWCPDAPSRRFRQATERLIQRTTDDAWSRSYARACPVAGLDHTLYRLRELTLPEGVRLLAGVHFRGQSTHYPFVGVFAQNRRLTASEMAAAHAALLGEFSGFAPRATWWWLPGGEDPPTLAGATPDQYLVMGSLDEIRKVPSLPLPGQWVLRRIDAAEEVSAAFAGLYQSFHRARPELAEAVPATKLEALVECAEAGGLYGCFAGAEVVGVMAVKPDNEYCVDAWLMWDIVLARPYCGKGLAPVLQRAVLDRLDAVRAPLVVGTIDARNLPSLRTALRVGRQIVGGWIFVPS
jgi:RimJ/RimL family protein N-acetyltransferase